MEASSADQELSSSSSSLSSLNPPTSVEDGEQPPPPEELVDPITLTLLVAPDQPNHQIVLVVQALLLVDHLFLLIVQEFAVVGPCGHSYSEETITKWLSIGPRSVCPVCKTAITQQQLIPNWALRNAVERYSTPPHVFIHPTTCFLTVLLQVRGRSWSQEEGEAGAEEDSRTRR